jgi:hypothetical protein
MEGSMEEEEEEEEEEVVALRMSSRQEGEDDHRVRSSEEASADGRAKCWVRREWKIARVVRPELRANGLL